MGIKNIAVAGLSALVIAGCSGSNSFLKGFYEESRHYTVIDISNVKSFLDCYKTGGVSGGVYSNLYEFRDAVMSFQRKNGLEAKGVLNDSTILKMVEVYESSPKPCAQDAYKGLLSLSERIKKSH